MPFPWRRHRCWQLGHETVKGLGLRAYGFGGLGAQGCGALGLGFRALDLGYRV